MYTLQFSLLKSLQYVTYSSNLWRKSPTLLYLYMSLLCIYLKTGRTIFFSLLPYSSGNFNNGKMCRNAVIYT